LKLWSMHQKRCTLRRQNNIQNIRENKSNE